MAIFDHCNNFNISGGTFNVWERPASPGSDFRTIRAGDLNLLTQVGFEETLQVNLAEPWGKRAVFQPKVVVGMRKVYRARVFGTPDPMTAVVYEGSLFDKWRAEAEQRQWPRHPLFFQLFGVIASKSINALVYHDEVITITCYKQMYRESPIVAACIEYQLAEDTAHVRAYLRDVVGIPRSQQWCLAWIRMSTGHLCIEMDEIAKRWPSELHVVIDNGPSLRQISILPGATDNEDRIRSIMRLDDIHEILQWISPTQVESQEHIVRRDIQLGQLVGKDCNINLHLGLPLSSFPAVVAPIFQVDPWCIWEREFRLFDVFSVQGNGWTRVTLPVSSDITLHYGIDLNPSLSLFLEKAWLSQANWCITQSLISGTREIPRESFYLCDRVVISISIKCPDTPVPIFPYLFLSRPVGHLVDGRFFVQIPSLETLFYWSFDPSGGERLDSNSIDQVPLPRIICRIKTCGSSWTSSHYKCLRDIHKAKGFDPDGPDAAISLGYPLVTPYDESQIK
ncbi:hypothetical protein B0H13DRAFT_339507 [Mycena leptocephala]|nr:hypothetical protein B0H13DRAFT_339507 [Mycena leptocephala]